MIGRWIADNLPGHGNGWEPYPLSLRIVNWIQWAQAGNVLESTWVHSLAVQIRFLAQRLEWHLLGNHLLANAKALVYAGLFFNGPEAEYWLMTGLRIFTRQLSEQILSDGGHFERSPMYHAIILKDVLDLINLARSYPGQIGESQAILWCEIASRMLVWLQAMTHPDGDISFFNDAAFGIAPNLVELTDYTQALGISVPVAADENAGSWPIILLRDSGYARLQAGPAVLLADVGMVGPDYLPGHAHADTLSFELSLFGQRIIVNSGTSCYGTSSERQRQRGTAAHNTVVIAGQDSSEVWGGFRVARRAWPVGLCSGEEINYCWVECGHDGYQRLSGQPSHIRRWRLAADRIIVQDRLSSNGAHHAVARYHLHPTIQTKLDADGCSGTLQLPDGSVLLFRLAPGPASLIPSTWHPQFGMSEPNECLEIHFDESELSLEIHWSDERYLGVPIRLS